MIRTILIPAALAALLTLATSSQVHAYGAVHAGYTTTGAGGTQHYGSTSAAGPYGSVSHTGSTTATPYGVQHTGSTTVDGNTYSSSGTRAYSPSTYHGYSAVGTTGTYNASVTRTGYYP
jgi:hypothetical protein